MRKPDRNKNKDDWWPSVSEKTWPLLLLGELDLCSTLFISWLKLWIESRYRWQTTIFKRRSSFRFSSEARIASFLDSSKCLNLQIDNQNIFNSCVSFIWLIRFCQLGLPNSTPEWLIANTNSFSCVTN